MLILLPPRDVANGSPHVVRCGDLLASLAQEANVRLEIPRTFAEHRVYVDRKGAPPLVVIRDVARAISASLIETKGDYEIRRTAADLQDIRARRSLQRGRWFGERLKDLDAFRKLTFASGPPEAAVLGAMRGDVAAWNEIAKGKRASYPTNTSWCLMPSQDLIDGLVRRIGVQTLADLPSERTQVYEDAPVPSAAPLPKHDDLFEAYVSAVDRLAVGDLAQKIKNEPTLVDSPVLPGALPGSPTSVVRLRLQCDSDEGSAMMTLEGYDRTGRRIDRAFLTASASGKRLSPMNFLRIEADHPETRWIALSSEAREALRVSAGSVATLPEWFLDPVAKEPLDLFVNEAVAGLVAEEGARCVAMDVPDGLWSKVRGCVAQGRVNLDALEKTLAEWLPYERIADPDDVAWRLVDPEISEARRADRSVLRRFAKTVVLGRRPDFRATCRLFHEASREASALPEMWSLVARLAGPPQSGSGLSYSTYSFLGAIPDAGWSRLADGETIAADRLGVAADLRRLFAMEPPPVEGDGPVPDLFQHPLELYPNGEIGATPISLRTTQEPVIRFWPAGKAETGFWSPEAGSTNVFQIPSIYFHQRNGKIVCDLGRKDYEKGLDQLTYRRGVRDGAKLTIVLPQGFRATAELPSSVTPEPKPFAYRDLPPSVRGANWQKALADGIAQAERDAKAPPAPGGAAAPPAVPR